MKWTVELGVRQTEVSNDPFWMTFGAEYSRRTVAFLHGSVFLAGMPEDVRLPVPVEFLGNDLGGRIIHRQERVYLTVQHGNPDDEDDVRRIGELLTDRQVVRREIERLRAELADVKKALDECEQSLDGWRNVARSYYDAYVARRRK